MSYLYNRYLRDDLRVNQVKTWAYKVTPCVSHINKELVDSLHRKGIKVAVWFECRNADWQKDVEVLKVLMAWQVDTIITDYVVEVKKLRKQIY